MGLDAGDDHDRPGDHVERPPHPGLGQRLAGYLASPETVLQLVDAHALESMAPAAGGIGLQPDWTALLQDLDEGTGFLREVFLR